MKRLISVTISAVFLTCMAGPSSAQRYDSRRGFWISGEAGMAYASVDCGTACYSDAVLAPMGVLNIGGHPWDRAMISFELSYLRTSADTTASDYGTGMAVLRFYPINNSLFVKLGAGVGRYGEERLSADGTRWVLSASGFAVQAGAGYEFPLSARFKFGPMVSYVAALEHLTKRNQLPENDMTGKFLRFGAQLTWH